MGKSLAEMMGVREGDEIAIVGQGADGSLANDLVQVQGLIQTPVDLVNRQGIVLEIGEAQTLFAMPDEAHEVVVHARDPDGVKLLASRLASLPNLAGTEVLDWPTLAPEMVSLIEIIEVAGVFALVLIFVAAASGVANTMLMATFERTHELGMLLALGAAPGRIVRMILAESIALGLTGAALGGTLGMLFVAVTHETGLDFAALTGGGPDRAFLRRPLVVDAVLSDPRAFGRGAHDPGRALDLAHRFRLARAASGPPRAGSRAEGLTWPGSPPSTRSGASGEISAAPPSRCSGSASAAPSRS